MEKPQKREQQPGPKFAPGMDNEFDEEASPREIAQGESTTVTKLVFDEVDPSEP